MKLRITPLNFATAFFFVVAALIFFKGAHVLNIAYSMPQQHLRVTLSVIFFFFGLVVAFLDVILRNFFPEMKKLWLVESCFIVLTAVIFLLIK
ncbi:hypothetical protein [Mucilaginibacter sp. PPCGB 2223]|uniref:hypothetical protein n=1 Tax=Mucilaginibacter sp. PPCGB 2223 TaxID=1886027 RepID=UPI001112A63A|nr:hypothetical protein [Mucilaginibacter sp. PPCGB 2223]